MSGTTANALMVCATNTEAFLKSSIDEQREAMCSSDLAVPEDIADVVGLLISHGARWATGSLVSACGGAVKLL